MPPPATQVSRTVFVANIPYDVSEEQIASVFSEVGPVANVEQERARGTPLFSSMATAHSAVRNLQDVPINGRPVRIELSTDDGGRRRGPPPRGGAGGFNRDMSPSVGGVDMSALPAGREPPPGQKATDAISKTLAEVNPGEMQRVMADMKALVTAQPEQARQLLADRPQLAYALFQAMLLLNIVDPSVLQRIQPLPGQNPGNPTAPAWGGAPPAGGYPPFPASGAAPPAPAPAAPAAGGTTALPRPKTIPRNRDTAAPQVDMAAIANEQQMLVQVLQLTQEQINALDPAQQASVKQLQFLGASA
ncbi:hypothetical protein A1Q1_00626 [Trichosporon asahii var. asahii CBS 2479]|uniref:RRM domain-containing protein n=1 Tax=Trichosporon asahii var. asahii (strain ATCC 90039 / CBS 2479 / JCM 2466 / KCTC 7840 / NBRC 103889/ NCYC 2677 / UAMH 7654) TaxID=1186058 RepID=J6EZR9_TRIAS|nr:hypothetical protein A1Q1_00626 [Trichosporon asahii var. asahii CBS 2479]EJT50159.1 hypothetical protein A1Q1_00626 [Trichosporon asahii var. asahii CBS 2479]